MEGNSRQTDVAKRLRPVFLGSVIVLVALLGFFAYSLAHSQSQQRRDAAHRFTDRAQVAASVNEALFKLASELTPANDAAQLGGASVSSQALAARTAQSQSPYELVVNTRGHVIAQTGQVPPDAARAALVTRALRTGSIQYSSAFRGPMGRSVLESATAFPTKYGPRVDITGVDVSFLARYLDSFLGPLPSVANSHSYVVDQNGILIAAPGLKFPPGTRIPDEALADASANSTHGNYGSAQYFASAPISHTPWRIILATSQSNLYSGINTTVPWIIFGAFVLMSALGVYAVRRALLANEQLVRADISRRHALEINDNIVQRLVLAKYALDRGATETSQQKLAETLHETQQLVTSLLEEKQIVPGSLRRERPAGTEGPPEPVAPAWQDGR